METLTTDNTGDCQAAVADSTTSGSTTVTVADNYGVGGAECRALPANAAQEEAAQQQVSSTTTMAATSTSNSNNKLKSQQQQQQQQHYQFRAPQQFVKHQRSSTVALSKKSKTWNKRQNKTAKQQQQNSLAATGCSVSHSTQPVGGGDAPPTAKADLENIQNYKNQLGSGGGGGGGGHYYHHGHRGGNGGEGRAGVEGRGGGGSGSIGITGNGLPPSALVGLDKLGYGHGHLKQQQLYKKMLMHRGHHHHVLCAGAAHNTLGGSGVGIIGGHIACCLVNGCNAGQSGKDASSAGVNSGQNPSVANALHFCCGRSKFFLPDKRPRKEIIIPPTKFLLGGNISDPLNLNSLQNETSNASSNNNTPATTPRQSPITTPPKVEVIIPPNIHDPLHLLDPVDSMEYEKQLTSPMKRCCPPRGPGKHHRHRKNRKPKRRRHESYTSTTSTVGPLDDTTSLCNSTVLTDASATTGSTLSLSLSSLLESGAGSSTSQSVRVAEERAEKVVSPGAPLSTMERNVEANAAVVSPPPHAAQQHVATATGSAGGGVAVEQLAPFVASDMLLLRERASRDLRLDLNSAPNANSTCSAAPGGGGGAIGGGGRKRKISESNNSQKNKKFHRTDAMDKIVSPVVPQPGAWKRPPRLVPSGARKSFTRRSVSVSESELLSPADELGKALHNLDAESTRVEMPDLNKVDTVSETGLGSPLSTTSGATSVATAEQELLADGISTGENSSHTLGGGNVLAGGDGDSTASIVINSSNKQAAIMGATVASMQVNITKMPKFTADGAKYRYGNYDRYSGFRHLNEFMDVRLQVFQRHTELFQNKDILDIGCNVGHMTITLARHLAPKSILGIDIDKDLVARARRNLDMYVRIPPAAASEAAAATAGVKGANELQCSRKTRRKRRAKAAVVAAQAQQHHHLLRQHLLLHHHLHHNGNNPYQQQLQQALLVPPEALFPISFPLAYGGIPPAAPEPAVGSSPAVTTGSTPGHASNASNTAATLPSTSAAKCRNDFPRNVCFRQTNYVLKDESQLCNDTQQYDLILCLSVTKWIHLNYGDAGLKLAFKRMFNQLRPGGKLILEAQNWASYKKKKNLTEEIYNNYRNIEFFPNKFHEYLLSTDVGFSHSYTLGVPRHLNKGFSRPIQLYAKGDYTPNHVRWSDAYYPQTPYEAYRGIYATMPPRPAGIVYPMSSTRSQAYDTPHYSGGASGPYSCRQTPMHQPTSQYYNPLETDSYQPSYDMEYLNHMYVFASPLYQTVWSPPASLRNSSSHTPLFGSVRDTELDGDGSSGGGGGSGSGGYHRHVYPPNEDTSSPNASAGGAFSSIRDPDTDDSNQLPAGHVYATNCGESSSQSPRVLNHLNDSEALIEEGLMMDEEPGVAVAGGNSGSCCDLNEA